MLKLSNLTLWEFIMLMSQMKQVLVSLSEGIFNQIHNLKCTLGESDSEVIRTMVISFLSEKGYLAKKKEQ
jgi:metal-responsive CopG/Arc/MetJ family transcriptional regulator